MSLAEIITIGNVTAKKYARGETIFSAGDPSEEGICIVLAGSVGTKIGEEIKDQLFSRVYQSGGVFGLLAMIGANRVETAYALIDDTKVLFVNDNDFKRYLKQDEKFLVNLFALVLSRLESIPATELRGPEEKIEIANLLGEKSALVLDQIRENNLRITDYLNKMYNKFVSPGGLLFDDQESDDSNFYLLLDGEIEQMIHDKEGNLIPVNSILPGQIFGFLRSSNRKGHALVARATNMTAKLVVLERDLLLKIARLDSSVALSIFKSMIFIVAQVEKSML